MAFKFIPDYSGVGEIMRDEAVLAALHTTAAEILPKAVSLAEAATLPEYAAALRVEDGIRPKGRPFSRVIADDPQATAVEYGDGHVPRRRILGQAANSVTTVSGPL
jgi:hypothetical protein